MDPARLDELLQLEDGRVDWKAGGDPEKVVRTLAAFANDFEGLGGGYVLCGVEEREGGDGAFPRAKLIGLDYDELRRVQNRVLSLCKKSLQPPISPSVDFVTLPGDRRLLVFFVAPSPGMVGLVKQGSVQTWIRIGDRVVQATADALERLLTTKGRWPPFLDRVCTEASRVDIDEAAVIAALGERGLPLQPLEYLMADQPLKGTAMPLFAKVRGPAAVEERPRYLALLLFGREPVRFIRGAHIQLSVYPGTTRDGSGERYELPAVGLLETLDLTLQRLDLYMGTAYDKSASIRSGRQNVPRYARPAVEEAVVNALVHRDYESPAPTKITVFSDRLEIQSPGGLVPGLDAARVRSGSSGALWRNPSLAAVMVAVGKAQEEGQGIPTIISTTKALAGKEPEFVIEPGMVTVVIPASRTAIGPAVSSTMGQRRQGVVLVSIGPSIAAQFETERDRLGLVDTEVLLDISIPGYLPAEPPEWQRHAEAIRDELAKLADRSDIAGLHVFYRGPVVFAPLFGALVAPIKPLYMYHLDPNIGYFLALSLDRKFLREAH